MQPPAPFSPQPAAAQELQQQAKTWLLISLLSSVVCVSLCLGIGGAVFCYLAAQSAAQGLTADAEAKLKWGKILTLSGSVMGICITGFALLSR